MYIISEISQAEQQDISLSIADLLSEVLSMEGRMTICNMSIEMGARGGLITPDETTFEYLRKASCNSGIDDLNHQSMNGESCEAIVMPSLTGDLKF